MGVPPTRRCVPVGELEGVARRSCRRRRQSEAEAAVEAAAEAAAAIDHRP